MGSRNRRPPVELVEKWIAQGYGQGEGAAYRPFFHVRDVPSKGRSAIVEGLKTGRDHHYLSDLEYYHHILAEFSPKVTDIREQFALLPWAETQEIAKDLGIRYPIYPGTSTPIVVTSDLVLTMQNDGLTVISVKYRAETERGNPKQERILEKLQIEQEYWKRRKVQWVLSTEKDICLTRAKNLAALRTAMVSRELDSRMPPVDDFVDIFLDKWEPHKNLNCILAETGNAFKLSPDVAFSVFGRAVWLRLLQVDLATTVDHFAPVNLIWN